MRERPAQVFPDKPVIAGIRVDPAEEIMANKLCPLLAPAEVRDLVDLRALEQAGLGLQDALDAGTRKDRGLTPAQLAWVLSEIRIGDDAQIPGGVAVSDLREYLRQLIDRSRGSPCRDERRMPGAARTFREAPTANGGIPTPWCKISPGGSAWP